MKTHEPRTLLAGILGISLAAAFSGPALAMDPDEEQLIRQGWKPQAAAVYEGTSLTLAADGELGFDDPRAGSSTYGPAAYQGTSMRAGAEHADVLGFTDPRPGDSSY